MRIHKYANGSNICVYIYTIYIQIYPNLYVYIERVGAIYIYMYKYVCIYIYIFKYPIISTHISNYVFLYVQMFQICPNVFKCTQPCQIYVQISPHVLQSFTYISNIPQFPDTPTHIEIYPNTQKYIRTQKHPRTSQTYI